MSATKEQVKAALDAAIARQVQLTTGGEHERAAEISRNVESLRATLADLPEDKPAPADKDQADKPPKK